MHLSDPEVLEFLTALHGGGWEAMCPEMVPPMLLRFPFMNARTTLVLEAVWMVGDAEFRCRLLIEVGWLEESLAIALEKGFVRLGRAIAR
jgi:hypothetical protein